MSSTVTAAEVSKNFGAYQDAAVREPVIITKNGRPRTVLMAYEDFVRLSKRDRRVQRTVDLTDEDIVAIEASEMASGYEHLNAELDGKMLPTEVRVGWIFRYAYLWDWQHREGREEGDKDRPCLVLAIVMTTEEGAPVVRVLPITHTPPADPADAIEIPAEIKTRLRRAERSWIVLTESNRFTWPGPDLRPVDSDSGYYGALTPGLFAEVKRRFVAIARGEMTAQARERLAHEMSGAAADIPHDVSWRVVRDKAQSLPTNQQRSGRAGRLQIRLRTVSRPPASKAARSPQTLRHRPRTLLRRKQNRPC